VSHRLTPEQIDAAACEWAERTAIAQGKPAGITDPVWLDRLATFMTSSPRPLSPAGGRRTSEPNSPSGSPSTRKPSPAADTGRGSASGSSPTAA
jgi:hypothetical protein